MITIRAHQFLLALLLLTSIAHGQEFQVGESVAIAIDNTAVKSKQQRLGSVPRDTEFTVRQKNGTWVLGQFQIAGKTILGWVPAKAVRRLGPQRKVVKLQTFSWENLFLASVKIDKYYDFEANADNYLQAFRPDVWKRYHDDEFQLHKKRAEALRIFQESVEQFDVEQPFEIPKTNVHFEKYDFMRSAFPIREATDQHYWSKTQYVGGDFPDSFRVFFANPEMLKYLPMAADEAESFLSTRKGKSGSVNRNIQASIRFLVRKRKDSTKNELSVEITKVKYYANDRLLYETPDAPRQEAAIAKETDALPEKVQSASAAKQTTVTETE